MAQFKYLSYLCITVHINCVNLLKIVLLEKSTVGGHEVPDYLTLHFTMSEGAKDHYLETLGGGGHLNIFDEPCYLLLQRMFVKNHYPFDHSLFSFNKVL